eukprot:g7154.t1
MPGAGARTTLQSLREDTIARLHTGDSAGALAHAQAALAWQQERVLRLQKTRAAGGGTAGDAGDQLLEQQTVPDLLLLCRACAAAGRKAEAANHAARALAVCRSFADAAADARHARQAAGAAAGVVDAGGASPRARHDSSGADSAAGAGPVSRGLSATALLALGRDDAIGF